MKPSNLGKKVILGDIIVEYGIPDVGLTPPITGSGAVVLGAVAGRVNLVIQVIGDPVPTRIKKGLPTNRHFHGV